MIYAFADLELHTGLYQLCRGDEAIKLAPRAFDLLLYLIEHRDSRGPSPPTCTQNSASSSERTGSQPEGDPRRVDC